MSATTFSDSPAKTKYGTVKPRWEWSSWYRTAQRTHINALSKVRSVCFPAVVFPDGRRYAGRIETADEYRTAQYQAWLASQTSQHN